MTIAPARLALCNAAIMVCLCMAGCAANGMFNPSPEGTGSAHTPTGQSIAPNAALDMIAIGKSAKADVSAALGRAIVIPFDSGYEVWVYRWADSDKTTRSATELVVLFEPSGLATKVRLRPGNATPN